jgi:hypothetical protein
MPKLLCPRGHVIDLSVVPAPGEHFYIETARWDEMIAAVAEAVSQVPEGSPTLMREAISDALAGIAQYFYKCPECGALSFPSEDPPKGYIPYGPPEEC